MSPTPPFNGRKPKIAARRWLLLAGVAGLLSLGLPWSSVYQPGFGYWSPGFCYTGYDSDGWASTYCDPWYVPGAGSIVRVIGAQHPARVLLLLTVLALIAGYRRESKALLKWAPVLAALGLFGFGVTGMAGQIVFAVGLAALLRALYLDGVLKSSPPVIEPSAAHSATTIG